MNTDGQVPHEDEFIADSKPAIDLSSTTIHDLGYVDTIVAGYVLITRTAGDTETKTFVALAQFDFDNTWRARLSASSYALHVVDVSRTKDGRVESKKKKRKVEMNTKKM